MVNKAQLPLFDDKGRPFGHFERGITYTAKRLNIGILVKKMSRQILKRQLFSRELKITEVFPIK